MKMTGTEMSFWVCWRLNCLKLIRVLRGAMELGPAQGEFKSDSSNGQRLSRDLVVAHEVGYS